MVRRLRLVALVQSWGSTLVQGKCNRGIKKNLTGNISTRKVYFVPRTETLMTDEKISRSWTKTFAIAAIPFERIRENITHTNKCFIYRNKKPPSNLLLNFKGIMNQNNDNTRLIIPQLV